MNKLINNLKQLAIVATLLIGAAVNSHAATAAVTTSAASTNSIIGGTNQVYISEITIANLVAQPLQVALFDAPSTNLTFTAGAYTNSFTYPTNYVVVFTNYSGIVQSNTNAATFTELRSIASHSVSYRLLASVAVGASSTVTYKPIDGLTTSYGVCSTNNTNCTITVTYSGIR